MVRRRLLSLLALAALVAACGGSAPAGSPTAPPASALPAGTYTSRAFQPPVTFTLPEGWDNPADAATYFQLIPAGSEVAGIHLFRDPAAASQDAECPEAPEPGVGRTSTELSAWIRGRPGLTVSDPKLVTVGGLRGIELDIGIADGWTPSCPFANDSPTVPLFVGSKGEYRWIVVGSERLRLYLFDLPGGGTLVIDIDAFDGRLIDELLAEASPIVASFRFATG